MAWRAENVKFMSHQNVSVAKRLIEDADLERFCETGVPLCVDEAYLDYNPDKPSKASLIEKYPQVFLSVTFSKAYGFCGIRFGFVLGTEEMIAAFNRMFLPWNVSRMAAAAAEAWGAPAARLATEGGRITDPESGRSVTYWQLRGGRRFWMRRWLS